MQLDDGNIYQHELLVTYPIVNQATTLVQGINLLIDHKNYVGALSLLRSLIEITMIFVYDCTAKKEKEFYEKFLSNGRLMKWSQKKKLWRNLRDDDLIVHFEATTKLGIRETYDNCCDVLHFSIRQMQLLAPNGASDELGRVANFYIGGSSPEIPESKYKEISKCAENCEHIISTYLEVMVKNKAEKPAHNEVSKDT